LNAAFFPGSGGRAVLGAALLFILLALAGCNSSGAYPEDLRYPPRTDVLVIKPPKNEELFAIPPGKLDERVSKVNGLEGGKALDPLKLKGDPQEKELTTALRKAFGTPAQPNVTIGSNYEDAEAVKSQCDQLQLTDKALAKGSELYRRNCLQCHGVVGDGRGPTGPWVSPPPRDYRQGIFKFASTDPTKSPKPSRADLHRTLLHGLEGTSMPSFGLLKEEDLQDLISYVIHLSIRGECEFDTLRLLLEGESLAGDTVAGQVDESLAKRVKQWHTATNNQIKPKSDPAYKDDENLRQAAVDRGYKLFIAPKGAICMSCHLDFGRQSVYKYDDWGTLVRPLNLTTGIYRGGRRPIDHYWRIRAGIKPVMPANPDLSETEVWDVVAFMQALPYPAMLPRDIREKIYGKRVTGSEVAGR